MVATMVSWSVGLLAWSVFAVVAAVFIVVVISSGGSGCCYW